MTVDLRVICLMDMLAQDIATVSYRKGSPFFRPADLGLTELPDIAEFRFDVMCGDTFAYSCADAEPFTMDEAPIVHRLYREGGYSALIKWVQERRGGPEKCPTIEQQRASK